MKKRVLAFLMTFVFALCLTAPAAIAEDAAPVYTQDENYLAGNWKATYNDYPFPSGTSLHTLLGKIEIVAELNFDDYDATKQTADQKYTGAWHVSSGYGKVYVSWTIYSLAQKIAEDEDIDLICGSEGIGLSKKYYIREDLTEGWVWMDSATGQMVAYSYVGVTAGAFDQSDVEDYANLTGQLDCRNHSMALECTLTEKCRKDLTEGVEEYLSGYSTEKIVNEIMSLDFKLDVVQSTKTAGHFSYCDVTAVDATCEADGHTAGPECPFCHEGKPDSTYQTLPGGHVEVIDKAVPATCKTPGLTAGSHCSRCGDPIIAQEVVPAGHTKVVTDPEVPATYTKAGKTQGSHCEACGATIVKQTTIPKLTIATPVNVKLSKSGSTITLTWDAVKDATGYLVQKKINDGEWKTGATVTSTTWKDTASKTSGKKYSYRVTAKVDTAKSSASKTVSTYYVGKVSAAPTVTAKSSSLSLSWKKVTGATKYQVYRSKAGGSYKLVGTVTSTSYSDQDITNGTKYSYKVRAVKVVSSTSYYGLYSSVTTTYFLSVPAISSVKSSAAGKMTVTLKEKNEKATGYQISYSKKSDFSDARTARITSYKTLTKTISSLTKGSKYYVKVRTYKTVNSATYYSAWTSSKTVTIKK